MTRRLARLAGACIVALAAVAALRAQDGPRGGARARRPGAANTASTRPAATQPARPAVANGPSGSFILRAKAIYPVTAAQPGALERGTIIVQDGKIVAVGGRDLPIPAALAQLPVIELRDSVVCPGFVSAASSLAGQHAGAPSVSAAYRAADAYDTYAEHTGSLSRGTTTVHLDPGEHRLVSGIGAVVKLAGPAEQRVLRRAADVCVTFGVFNPPPLGRAPFYASSDQPIEPFEHQRPDSRAGQFLELEERIAAAESADPSNTPGSESKTRSENQTGTNPAAAAVAQPPHVTRQPDDKLVNVPGPMFDPHSAAFAEAWRAKLPLRVQVRRATDIAGTVEFVQRLNAGGRGRPAYLVGLTEGDELPGALLNAGLPLVVRVERSFRLPGANVGEDPTALEPLLTVPAGVANAAAGQPTAIGQEKATGREKAPALGAVQLALAGAAGDRGEDLRMAAILALRGGLPREQALAAISRVPAEILGVDAQVGSLAPGKDADLVVLTGDPLDVNASVERVYVSGQPVFAAPGTAGQTPLDTAASQPARRPLVIRGGTIWTGAGAVLHDGSLLIEDGKIQAVGQRVPTPPFAQIVDAGPDAYVVPGFIDAYGHLGLHGDQVTAGPELAPHRAIVAANLEALFIHLTGKQLRD